MTQTLAFRARLRGYIDSQWDLNLGEFRDADDNPVDLSSRSFVGEARATADGADVLVTLAVTGTVNGALRLQSPNADNKGLSVGEAAFSVMETTGGSWELVGTGSIDLRKHATRSTGDFSAFTDIGGGLRILFAEAIGDSKLIMRGRDGITLPEVTSVYDDTITARDKSQDWAEKAEDSEVETGKYSALHHSAKALGQRVLAETAKTDAQAVTVSIVETTETVGGSSKTNTLEVTAPYTNTSYANPFTGWGEIYNPAGISFNCIRPRIISRRASLTTDADKWERINVVVRTGATPHLSGSTVLAVGDIKVKPDDDILYDLEILLTDSISGLVKTLTDADMIDSKYFIAVWASRADGGVAYMSPHTGTLPNTAGTSWYMSAGGDAVNDSYAVFTGNWRLGVDHVLVADPEKVTTYTPQDAFKDDILGDTLGITDYGFDIDEGVSADGESVTLAMTGGQSSGVRDLPFSGWGETYTANGVSFNAIRAKIIGRALNIPASSKWERIHAVVRTGAIPGGTENTVLAIGSVRVRKTSDTLTDVTIILKDPVTGSIVTIDDGDFIGGKYFIGLYARTLLGDFAAMAEHFGSLPNGETSYYTTTGEPINGAWALNSGNSRLGVEHLLLTNPVTTVNYNATDEFKNDVNDVVSAQNWAPPKMYAVEGLETSVYFDNLIAGDYDDYHWSVSGLSKGIQQNERWMLNLDAADIGGGTQSITVYQKGTESALFTKNIELEAALASAGTGVTVNYMMIGDSLTASGVITSTLLALASSDPLTINMVGIRGSGSNLHEGRSGWT
ncbi:hypothetical protein, partial [uncultured Paraglaciecola sp.]|uniref:hypothetical protein n=1 Tax=uncultured Paraglaciecola sp. TaxID=1765024 RepID=UPI0026040037